MSTTIPLNAPFVGSEDTFSSTVQLSAVKHLTMTAFDNETSHFATDVSHKRTYDFTVTNTYKNAIIFHLKLPNDSLRRDSLAGYFLDQIGPSFYNNLKKCSERIKCNSQLLQNKCKNFKTVIILIDFLNKLPTLMLRTTQHFLKSRT